MDHDAALRNLRAYDCITKEVLCPADGDMYFGSVLVALLCVGASGTRAIPVGSAPLSSKRLAFLRSMFTSSLSIDLEASTSRSERDWSRFRSHSGEVRPRARFPFRVSHLWTAIRDGIAEGEHGDARTCEFDKEVDTLDEGASMGRSHPSVVDVLVVATRGAVACSNLVKDDPMVRGGSRHRASAVERVLQVLAVLSVGYLLDRSPDGGSCSVLSPRDISVLMGTFTNATPWEGCKLLCVVLEVFLRVSTCHVDRARSVPSVSMAVSSDTEPRTVVMAMVPLMYRLAVLDCTDRFAGGTCGMCQIEARHWCEWYEMVDGDGKGGRDTTSLQIDHFEGGTASEGSVHGESCSEAPVCAEVANLRLVVLLQRGGFLSELVFGPGKRCVAEATWKCCIEAIIHGILAWKLSSRIPSGLQLALQSVISVARTSERATLLVRRCFSDPGETLWCGILLASIKGDGNVGVSDVDTGKTYICDVVQKVFSAYTRKQSAMDSWFVAEVETVCMDLRKLCTVLST